MRISCRPQGPFAVRSCVNRDASFGIHWAAAAVEEDQSPSSSSSSSPPLDDDDVDHTYPSFEIVTAKILDDDDSSVASAASDLQLTSTSSSDGGVNPLSSILSGDVEVDSCGVVDCVFANVSPLPTTQKDNTPPPAEEEDNDPLHSQLLLSRREFCDSQVAQYRAHLEERRRLKDELEFHRLHYDAMLGDMYQRHNRPRADDCVPSLSYEDTSFTPLSSNPIDDQAARNRLNSIRHIIAEGARHDHSLISKCRARQQVLQEEERPSALESFVRANYMHRLYWTHVMDDALNLLSSTDQSPLNTPPTYNAYSTVLNRLSQRQMWRGPVSSCYKLVVEKAASSPKVTSKRRGGYYHGLIKEAESLRDGSMRAQAWKAAQEVTLHRIAKGSLFVAQ